MFKTVSVLMLTALAPTLSWAAFTGEYATPDGTTTMQIVARAQSFTVVVHKDTQNDTCDVKFNLFEDDSNTNKLFAKVDGCYVTVLTGNDWASMTGNGECSNLCEVGSIDTQGLKHR